MTATRRFLLILVGVGMACSSDAPSGTAARLQWEHELTADMPTSIDGTTDMVLVAASELWARSGGSWAALPVEGGAWHSVRMGKDGTAWVTSRTSAVARFDGRRWTTTRRTDRGMGVDVAQLGDEVWVTGTHDEIHRWTGKAGWQEWNPPELSRHHTGVLWGASLQDVWLAVQPRETGRAPELAHWDGVGWTIEPLQSKGYITSMDGSASDDVWAVGYTVKMIGKGPLVAHWDGKRWSELEVPSGSRLADVDVDAHGVVWIAGHDGVLLRGDERGFSRVAAPPGDLHGVVALPGGELWVLVDGDHVHHAVWTP